MGRKKRQRRPAAIKEEEEEEDTSNLPWEVIYIILSKLPVKSLLRFRCVSKPWLALISEPKFIKTHLNESIKSGRQRLICSVYNPTCFYSVDYETCGKPEEEIINFPIKKYRKADVLCSYNGLVLLGLVRNKMHMLWNPSTREYKRFSCPSSEICNLSNHTICYDSSIDDYKVLLVSYHGNIMVYSLKTNSWTETNHGFPNLKPLSVGVTLSGVLHWIVDLQKGHKLECVHHNNNSLTTKASETSSSNDNIHCDKAVHKSFTIVCFDLVEDKIKAVPTPIWMGEGVVFHLTIMRGCLGLYINSRDNHQVDVWFMEEYGVRNSWTKYYTIPRNVGTTVLDYLNILSYTKKGEVVSMYNYDIFLYDPKENKLRNAIRSTGIMRPFTAVPYVDSLVLPTH